MVTTGRRTPPRAATGDFEPSMSAAQRAAVDKAVAWAIKRLLAAEDQSNYVYFAIAAARKNPRRPAASMTSPASARC